ncbi:MAG: UDP-glucose 4-epimerase GalE [Candidatus Dependentiae bacterium]
MRQKAILITGGAGYIGSHTAWLMAQQGFHVIIIDTLIYKQSASFGWATCIHDDFANEATLRHIFSQYNVQAVMHFAAYIEVNASIKDPRHYYENNVIKTCKLLQIMLEHNIKQFIFSSSCALYGNPQYTPIDEQHTKNPITPYGASKYMVEQILQDYNQAYNMQYVSLRYFNAAGGDPDHNLGEQHEPETHIIPLLLQALKQRTPFKIFGTDYETPDGTCIRDFLHVKDIAHAHSLALEHLMHNNPSDYFNLGTGRGVSIKELLDIAQKTFKTSLHIVYDKRRAGDPAILVANALKAKRILNWYPHYSDIKYILHSANEYMTHQNHRKQILQTHV